MKIDPAEFAALMREFSNAQGADIEAAHEKADALMCLTLSALGYKEGIEIYKKMERWYS